MTATQWTRFTAVLALAAAGLLLLTGNTHPGVYAVLVLAVIALLTTAPIEAGTWQRRSTPIAIPGADAPSLSGAGDGLHARGAR
jgi:hypothetical protein